MSQPVSASGVLSWLVCEDGGAAGATAAPPAPCPCAKGAQHSASGLRPLSAHKLEPKWVCEHLNTPERLPWHRRGSGWHHCELSHATAKQPEHRPCWRRWMGTGGISGSHLLPSLPGPCTSLLQLNAKRGVVPVLEIPSSAALLSNKPWAVCTGFCKAEGVAARGC